MRGETDSNDRSTPVALKIPVVMKRRKPTRLARWQAYSRIYFKKGTSLHSELHSDHHDLLAGDDAALAKYAYLFPTLDDSDLCKVPWLPFYQAVMQMRVKCSSEEETLAVKAYVERRYKKEVDLHDRPWDACAKGEDDSEAVKKNRYLRS
jgi:hypothetical protein